MVWIGGSGADNCARSLQHSIANSCLRLGIGVFASGKSVGPQSHGRHLAPVLSGRRIEAGKSTRHSCSKRIGDRRLRPWCAKAPPPPKGVRPSNSNRHTRRLKSRADSGRSHWDTVRSTSRRGARHPGRAWQTSHRRARKPARRSRPPRPDRQWRRCLCRAQSRFR